MKQVLLLGMLLIWCNGSAFAQDMSWRAEGGMPKYGSLEIRGRENFGEVGAEADYSPSVNALNFFVKPDEMNKFVFGYLGKKELRRNGTGIKVRYELNLPLLSGSSWNISSEAKVALGYIDAKYVSRSISGFGCDNKMSHMLLGLSNHLKGEWRVNEAKSILKIGGDTTGSNMHDYWGDLAQWDNHRVGMSGAVEIPISEAKFSAEFSAHRVKYNPERYFFVEKWTKDYRGRTELMMPLGQWHLIPSLEYQKLDIERDRRVDLERPEYGFAVVRKNLLRSKYDGFLKGVYAPWMHKSGRETLVAVGINSSNSSGEIYRREIVDRYSSFVLKENIYGLRFSWKFGESEKEIRKGIKKYGEMVSDKYAFYHRGDSLKDDNSLTFNQQAERIGSVRRRVEWSGNSLEWKQAPTTGVGFRYPDETYAGRTGDCDEQSCMNNRLDRLNGYQSYTAGYWDSGISSVGHAVTVFQDPTNGQWFLEEYGMTYKINGLSPNATKEEAMRVGLLQNSQFLALRIKNSGSAVFTPWDCYEPNSPARTYYSFGAIPTSTSRPSIERGVELFTKRGFLFE